MSKLYVGNLPNVVTEADLHLLFFESGIATSAVLLKKGGYAFVDCYEQSLADRAIDKLNGAVFLGSQIVVEPSVAAAQKRKSTTKIEMGGGEPMANEYIIR
ncbi:hypothetical protein GE061_008416 [Apolygus lucorum]|uniref:RRM domain-containing protein n=1 Tax=Apolygus lucorum TaxID=248454 RepID=A0A8S9WR14_APOLU|nr:hypothetical protein GE061_008416 [Apolygus lucorum]